MNKGRIFIVEDEALIAMELADRLARLGYEVVGTASRGEEALDRVPDLAPDIVLMDIRLAGDLDGIEAARRLRERTEVPVIYLTAYADPALIERATMTDPYGYLSKPFEAKEIVATIEMALYKHRTGIALRRNAEIQAAVNRTLKITMSEPDLDGALLQVLDVILSVRSLAFEDRGAIFLADAAGGRLLMKAQRNLPGEVLEACAAIPFGTCLCGAAAQDRCVAFGRGEGGCGRVGFQELAQSMHYCVPVQSRDEVLGVVTIAARRDHARSGFEEQFLLAVADALAGVIVRERAERSLRESEQRYRLLAETAPDHIFITNPDHTILYMNHVAARSVGRRPEAVVGMRLDDLFPPPVVAEMQSKMDMVLRDGAPMSMEEKLLFSGREVWFSTILTPLKDPGGATTAVMGISRDITDRKLAEDEREKYIADLTKLMNIISRSHKEWQQTFDGIGDMISIHDRQCTIIKANRAFAAFLGHDPKDIVHRKCHELVHGTCDPIGGCPHLKTLGDGIAHNEEVHDPRSGKTLRVSTFPWYDEDGAVAGSIHIAKDITEEKDREMRLILAERLAALGQMASGIAHEINNPLAAISGCAEGLRNRISQGRYDADFFQQYLTIIEEEVGRCKAITTNMLSFVRKASADRKPLDIPSLMDKTLDIIGIQGRLKSVKVVRDYQRDVRPVPGSEGEVRQFLLAMVTNALDAMSDKGVLTAGIRADGGRAIITIADTGSGIAPDNLTRIFDPFFTTKNETGGTGLGLSIAKKIVSNHSGTIDVQSLPGKGTTFTISLPHS